MIGLSIGLTGQQPLSLLAQALSAIRRNGGTALYVPDDYGLVLGPELVTNGDFSAGTAGWQNLASLPDWSIASGVLIKTGTTSGGGPMQENTAPFVAGKSYRVSYEIKSISGGLMTVQLNGGSSVLGVYRSAVGVYTEVIVAGVGNQYVRVVANNALATGSVDNISVREVISATTYIDSTGTQPVTAINDLVGLLTDRSYGAGNLGGELSPGTASTAGWANNGFATVTTNGTILTVQNTGAVEGVATFGSVVANKAYRFTITVTSAFGSGRVTIGGTTFMLSGNPGTYTGVIVAASSTNVAVASNNATVSGVIAFSSLSVREVLGNHASQGTTASKPLVTRVPKRLGPNLVVNGGFDGGTGWSDASTAPATAVISGGIATLTRTDANNARLDTSFPTVAGRSYRMALTYTGTNVQATAGTAAGFGDVLSATVLSGFPLVFVAQSSTTHIRFGTFIGIGVTTLDNVEVREVLEWTPALKFDGSNDFLVTGNPSITTACTIIMAYTQTGADGLFVMTGQNANGAELVKSGNVVYFSKASAGTIVSAPAGSFPQSVPHVLTARIDPSGNAVIRKNGAVIASATVPTTFTATSGMGIAAQAGSSFPFPAQIQSYVLTNTAIPDAELKTIERWMAQQIGVTYVG